MPLRAQPDPAAARRHSRCVTSASSRRCGKYSHSLVSHTRGSSGSWQAVFCYAMRLLYNIGSQMENPFGGDAIDHPIDKFCTVVEAQVCDACEPNL